MVAGRELTDALNDVANIANHLHGDLTEVAEKWAHDTLWAAVNTIREHVFGPHDGQYPIKSASLPVTTPETP